jgi:hypothetical protein
VEVETTSGTRQVFMGEAGAEIDELEVTYTECDLIEGRSSLLNMDYKYPYMVIPNSVPNKITQIFVNILGGLHCPIRSSFHIRIFGVQEGIPMAARWRSEQDSR